MKKLSNASKFAIKNFDDLPRSAQVRIDVVAQLKGVSVPTIWRRVREGNFPPPRKEGNASTWTVGQVRDS